MENLVEEIMKSVFEDLSQSEETQSERLSRFTLIELLVIVAIIAILLTILLPSLRKAKESAYFAVCSGQQKQIFTLGMLGSKDNDSYAPNFIDEQSHINS